VRLFIHKMSVDYNDTNPKAMLDYRDRIPQHVLVTNCYVKPYQESYDNDMCLG
jgi:hypothetical protein